MPTLPTAEEAFGMMRSPGGQLPTAEEAFANIPQRSFLSPIVPDEPAAQRIFNSFVGPAAKAFGPEPLSQSAEKMGLFPKHYEEQLRKSGFWNDYSKGQYDVRKDFMERTFMATVGTLATTMRAGSAAIAAPIEVVSKLISDITGTPLEDVEREVGGALSDPGLAMIPGAGGVVEPMRMMVKAQRAANLRTTLSAARARAVVGPEGEPGYFEAVPLSPENALARAEAAKEAGIPTPVPEPVAPDVHVLARRVNPPVFEQYEALEAAKSAHRTTIQTLATAREALPEVVQAQEEIRTILGKVHGVEERLTPATRARLEAAQGRLDKVLNVATPEMLKAGRAFLQAEGAQKTLVPEVQGAYRQAHEMLPPATEKVAEAAVKVSDEAPLPVGATRALTEEVAEEVIEAPKAEAAPQVKFTTAKGSTYKVEAGGKTTRDKMARPEHPGAHERGPQPTSETTFYVDEAGLNALAEFQAQGMGNKAIVLHSSGRFGLKYLEGKNAGKFESRTMVTPKTEPEVGLYPVELFKGGERVHFGNKITAVDRGAERVEPPKAAPGGPTRTTTQLRSVEGTGQLLPRGLSTNIEASAIEAKLTESFGDLPEYNQLSMAEQASAAVAFIAKSPEDALAVALGKKAPPRGVLPESILVAVEKQAIAEGDVETLRQLATESSLSKAATTMGQRIRTLGERSPTSPVGQIHAVQEARRAALETRQASALKDAQREIKAEMRRNAPTRDAWAAFIQEITCKT